MEVQILAADAPPELVARIDADARERNVTFQEAVVSALAKRFKVRRTASVRSYVDTPQGTTIHVKVSVDLRTQLRLQAAERNGTLRGVILDELAKHYGLPAVSTDRRSRSR